MDKSPLQSFHIFVFPFKWEIFGGDKHSTLPLSNRVNLKQAQKCINLDFWHTFKFKIKIDEGVQTYNEYSYFHDHARDVLNLNLDTRGDRLSVLQYDYKSISETSKATYNLTIGKCKYTLGLKEVFLNVYENGVGILSFHVENRTYTNKEDIFKINDFGRRIYPQFLGSVKPFTDAPKNNFLAHSIEIRGVKTEQGNVIEEDFSYFDKLSNYENDPFRLPKHLSMLLGSRVKTNKNDSYQDDMLISPLMDDRMYVLSFYMNDEFAESLKIPASSSKALGTELCYEYQQNEMWYQYIFLDGSSVSCQSERMKAAHLTTATYDRWLGESMFYGITRYSFMVLAKKGWFPENIILNHFKSMYFQMAVLCLVQRASVLHFSSEVARIAHRLSDDPRQISHEQNAITQLYLKYIKFINGIYFREVSPQEQGIELYELMQQQMRIRSDIEDLKSEIAELNSLADTLQQSDLTLIAGRFLFPSLVAAIFGISDLTGWVSIADPSYKGWIWGTQVLFVFICFVMAGTFLKWLKKWR